MLGVVAPNADGTRDQRLPRPATRSCAGTWVLVWGETLRVTVLSTGFEFPASDKGERYDALSAIAKAVTGSHINGFRFFRLVKVAA